MNSIRIRVGFQIQAFHDTSGNARVPVFPQAIRIFVTVNKPVFLKAIQDDTDLKDHIADAINNLRMLSSVMNR